MRGLGVSPAGTGGAVVDIAPAAAGTAQVVAPARAAATVVAVD